MPADLHVRLVAKYTFTVYQVNCCQDTENCFYLGFPGSDTSANNNGKQLVLQGYSFTCKIGHLHSVFSYIDERG